MFTKSDATSLQGKTALVIGASSGVGRATVNALISRGALVTATARGREASDTQAAFHLIKTALTMPLSSGSAVVLVSSGAAIDGSPLSGGYAGAKGQKSGTPQRRLMANCAVFRPQTS